VRTFLNAGALLPNQRREYSVLSAKHRARALGSLVGFRVGSGGLDGDGGVPDLDFDLFGLGSYRSMLTHSIIGGASIETVVASLIHTWRRLLQHMPADRDPAWTKVEAHIDMLANGLVAGADAGIAWHLFVDVSIDGFTPYKDLPVSLPLWGHKALFFLNSIGSATHALRRDIDR